MRRTLGALATAAGALLVMATTGVPGAGAAGEAATGGWATTTLDETPQAEPGETTEVGFTILQHGRTPVAVEDVAVIVRDEGTDQEWPAVAQGKTGHYVAEVTFPAEGDYTWAVRQGWFGEYDLGPLEVGGGAGTAAAASTSWWSDSPWALRVLLVLPIVASVGLFLRDRRSRSRSRRRPVQVAEVISG
jgi:hypothetical protein